MFEPYNMAASKTPPRSVPPKAFPPRPVLHTHEPRSKRHLTTILLLSLTALGMFSGGIFFVLPLSGTSLEHPPQASIGLLILLAAAIQSRLAYFAAKPLKSDRRAAALVHRFMTRHTLRVLTVAFACGYAACLLVQPADAAVAVFAATASWSTMLVAALTANSDALSRWRKWGQSHGARRCGSCVYLAVLLVVGVELGGRTIAGLSQHDLALVGPHASALDTARQAVADQPAPPTETAVTAQQLKTLMSTARSGVFRVAVLGDEMVLAGSPQASFLAQMERTIPGVEIHNFGVAQAGPREYAARVDQQLTAVRPDLVLAFVSLGDDFTTEVSQPGIFEWRSLWIAQEIAKRITGDGPPAAPTASLGQSQHDQQSFLQICGPHLTVCRTPIDSAMQRRWQAGLAHLDRLIARCHSERLNLAFVAVPGEFQVNSLLCEMLRRRAGFSPQDVDLQLPQRRLSAFAEQRRLPLLDLLPYLQRSGRPIYERNNLAWNDEGHAVAARAVSSWLQNRYGSLIAATAQLSQHD